MTELEQLRQQLAEAHTKIDELNQYVSDAKLLRKLLGYEYWHRQGLVGIDHDSDVRKAINDAPRKYMNRAGDAAIVCSYTDPELAAIEAREKVLREKVSELIKVAPSSAGQCSGLKCREPYCYSCNDEDSTNAYLQSVWDLCHSARELLKQTDDSALQAALAEERERCAKVCEKESTDIHNLPGAIVAGRCVDAIRNMKGS